MALTAPTPPPVRWTLGDYMLKARKTAGLEQKDVAERVGVSRSLVGRWENDLSEPSYRKLARFAEVTGFPLDVLLSVIGYKSNIAGGHPFDLLHGSPEAIQTTLNLYPAVRSVHSG